MGQSTQCCRDSSDSTATIPSSKQRRPLDTEESCESDDAPPEQSQAQNVADGEVASGEAQAQSLGSQLAREPGEWNTDGGEDDGATAGEQEECRRSSYFDPEAIDTTSAVGAAVVAGIEDHVGQRPPVRFSRGSVYDGQWRGLRREGFGTQTWLDGAKYAGQWKDNQAEGKGCFRHSNGDRYIGMWRNNVAHGYGIFYNKRGMTYHGEWCNDVQEGNGLESWSHSGCQYQGQFRGGNKEGVGKYRWPDGSEYLGRWASDCINGEGMYVGSDARRFRGLWRDFVMHGSGMYVWRDGRVFCGQYRFDKKEGFGTFTWPDGRKYTGYWKNGKQHGYGLYVAPGSSEQSAYWKEGQRAESYSVSSASTVVLSRYRE